MAQLALLLERLDARIARTEGVFERERLKSRRAATLARHGQFADARYALSGLRSQSQRLREPVLAAWVALIEGLIEHGETLSPSAREKFQRARELAATTTDVSLQAEAAAWLANADFNANDLADTVAHAAEALRLAPPDQHATRTRVSLVIGSAWRIAGDDACAQRWYERARQSAGADGDASSVRMLLFNLAAFRANLIVLDDAFDRADLADAQRVLLEVESSANYDACVGKGQLPAEVPLMRAQLMTVLGRYEEAIALFDAELVRAVSEGQTRREALFLADAVYAEARLGRFEEAARRLRNALAALPAMTESDDIAAAHNRLAVSLKLLGRAKEAVSHRARAIEALAAHEVEQRRWAEALRAAGLA